MECLRSSFKAGVLLGGRYETLSPLNHGSFGMVFMARDVQTNQTVAIKCLTKTATADEAFSNFAIDDKSEELTLHSRLGSHPNIVNLLDSFETDAHFYLVLEFCSRGDLYEAIRQGQGPLETEHVRRFMLELVDAVAFMHSKGIYHRDIKPENVFLTQSGSVKLGDFGLATTDRWTYETTVGSDRYMSPEQYDSAGAGYSPAQADIWAIGICLLNVLFSRNPFTTPTESDPLFLDYSRDKQSLFDVFPSMSQDTYEVIVQCMNLDPSKRSLIGARNAINRVISFTTLDEALDDFCSTDRRVIATANREPLRTPSIQSPQVDTGAFPWAKALQTTSPQKIPRQLSVIPDTESYSEELFSKSEATTDWISAAAQTPSISSTLDSNLGASMQSLDIGGSTLVKSRLRAKVSPMAGSLPIAMSKPRNHPSAMSLVFGRRDTMSKSWSDMWDEDVEEQEEERTQKINALKEINARTWSHESKLNDPNDDTPRAGLSPATKSSAIVVPGEIPSIDSAISDDIDGELVADGFFFEEAPAVMRSTDGSARYSPPPKRTAVDKWAALGERRRAYTNSSTPASSKQTAHKTSGKGVGSPVDSVPPLPSQVSSPQSPRSGPASQAYSFINYPGFGHHSQHHSHNQNHGQTTTNKWNSNQATPKDRATKARGREWNWNWNWRKEKRPADFGDIEWVGGWSEAPVSS